VDDPAGIGRDIAVALLVLAAAAFDVRVRRIPWWLTVPGIGAGVCFGAITSTPRQFAGWMAITALTFAAGFVLYIASILGGGDGKLLTCVAAMAGPGMFAECIAWMLITGVVVSIAILTWTRALVPFARRVGVSLVQFMRSGTISDPMEGREPHRMPFAVVVCGGVLTALVAHRIGIRLLT
jgi:Flp pilus assembly protein protease CpaA